MVHGVWCVARSAWRVVSGVLCVGRNRGNMREKGKQKRTVHLLHELVKFCGGVVVELGVKSENYWNAPTTHGACACVASAT